jgi:2-polyprenyl-3-methyl-5-hydroxy-6-metoxy-1,4-benzoquinol methylase
MVRNRLRRKELYSSAEYWNAKADDHDARPASMWPNDALNEFYHAEQMRHLAELLPDVRGWRALDVGCGTGRLSRHFAARGALVSGFDFAAKAVALAQAAPLPAAAEPGVAVAPPEYRVGSVFELAAAAEFDLAFTWGVLTMACKTRDDFRRAVGRIVAALKPGATLLLIEPFHRGPLQRVLPLRLDDAAADVAAAGATVKSVRGLHFWPARVLLGYVPWPRWITAPGYAAGQRFLAGPRWGDYKLVEATRLA